MPKFHWRGRTRDGREIEGEMDAPLKDTVVASLHKQGIVVIDVETGGDEIGPPMPERAESRSRDLIIAIGFIVAAIVAFYAYRC